MGGSDQWAAAPSLDRLVLHLRTWAMRRSLLLLLAFSISSTLVLPAAHADDSAKINARIETWGRNCKNIVAGKYPKAVMSDISVQLSASDRKDIDSGERTLKDINKSGLSYNWSVMKHSGYCNTDGKGKVTEFVKGQ